MKIVNSNTESELIEKAKHAHEEFLNANGNSTKAFIDLGKALILLKDSAGPKRNWTKYRERDLPWLDKKRDERARKIADKVDLDRNPALAYLSQRTLLKLASLTGDESLFDILRTNNIDCAFPDGDQERLKEMEEKIDNFIKSQNAVNQEEGGNVNAKGIVKRFSRSVTELSRIFNEIVGVEELRDELRKVDLEEIEGSLSTVLHQLREIMQASD